MGVQVTAEFLLTPAARWLSESKGIDVTSIGGSGRGGRITKGDILTALSSGVSFPAAGVSVAADATAAVAPAAPTPVGTVPAPAAPRVPLAPVPTTEGGGVFEDVTASGMRKVRFCSSPLRFDPRSFLFAFSPLSPGQRTLPDFHRRLHRSNFRGFLSRPVFVSRFFSLLLN